MTDAAIDLLAASGVHGLTHREVEKAAGLPVGTAANYFRSRQALLVATAERIVELHHADMDQATQAQMATAAPPAATAGQLAEMLAEALFVAATTQRTRYLAIFELQLEAVRRPVLATALAGLADSSLRITSGYHADLGQPIAQDQVPVLITLYSGALFTLVTAPPETVSKGVVEGIVHAMLHGVLPDPTRPRRRVPGNRHTNRR